MDLGAESVSVPPPRDSNNPFANLADIKLDEKTQETLYERVAEGLTTPESQRELLKKIDQVAEAVKSTRTTFTTILSSLREVAIATTARKSECNALVIEWEGHFKTFDSCVLESRRVAAKAHVVADDFAKEFSEFLYDKTVPLEDKKAEMMQHKVLMQDGGVEAGKLHGQFKQLSRDVDAFSSKWRQLLNTLNLDTNKAREDLEAQKKMVSHVNSELVAAKNKTSTLAKWFCGVGVVCAAVAIGVFLAPITLTTAQIAIASVAGGLAVGGLAGAVASEYSNSKRLREQHAAKKRELDAMVQSASNASSTLSAALLKKDLGFTSIINNINLLSDIWGMVAADIASFEKRIDLLSSQRTEGLFYRRLQATAPLYLALANALRKYALAIPEEF